MSLIASLCAVEDILLGGDISSKSRLFEVLARHVEQRYGLPARDIVENLSGREALGSTALGNGVAIPHARITGIDKVIAVFMRPKKPMPFDAPDRKPVSDVFVLLVPDDAQQEHLLVLADIARLFSDRRFREQLKLCGSAAAVSRILCDWQSTP